MALPALPAIASFAGKSLTSLGIWQGGKAAFRGLKNKLGGVLPFIKQNPGAAGSIAKGGGILGGLGIAGMTISDAFSAVGIEDGQVRLGILLVAGLGGIAALGSLFDIQLGGDS